MSDPDSSYTEDEIFIASEFGDLYADLKLRAAGLSHLSDQDLQKRRQAIVEAAKQRNIPEDRMKWIFTDVVNRSSKNGNGEQG